MPGTFSLTHGFGLLARSIIVIDSTPPPITTSTPSLRMWLAASAMAFSPEEQTRLMVTPATLTGRPARTAATRAMLWPWAPCGWPQPRMTSSTSFFSSWGALPSTSLQPCAARSDGSVMLNEPRCDLASGVRELATTTASLMVDPLLGRVPQILRPFGAAGNPRHRQAPAGRARGFGAGALDLLDALGRSGGQVLDASRRHEDVVLNP